MIGRHSTRRQLVLLAATALGSTLLGRAVAAPGDQGIGGTGFTVRPADEDGDRGIGGTGVIGTIRRFGSIIVNDLRIAYPKDAVVRIDGRAARPTDLKLGQVVRVVAERDAAGTLSTRAIDVTSEVVGPIEAVRRGGLTVLGQSVSTAGLRDAAQWRQGDTVAVSGLRRPDGTVVASLIERRETALVRVAGPVTQGADGGLRIGALRLTGANGALVGHRAVVEGQAAGRSLAVERETGEAELLPRNVRTFSVEAYVERRGDDLHLGSGLAVAPSGATDLPADRTVRAVLTGTVAADGRLAVNGIQAGGQRYRAAPRGGSEGGRIPMDFGRPGGGTPERDEQSPGGGLFGSPGSGGDSGRFAPRGSGGGPGGGGFGGGGPGGPGRR